MPLLLSAAVLCCLLLPGSSPMTQTSRPATQAALPSVLWVGPWYDPAQPFTVQRAVAEYGVGAVMYDLDWVDGNYFDLSRPYGLAAYVDFARARIGEADQVGAHLWFSTLAPFMVNSDPWGVWRALSPVFSDPAVLGVMLPDEPEGISPAAMTPESEAAGVEAFHALFPGRLAWQNVVAPGVTAATRRWAPLGDVFSADFYPPLGPDWQAVYAHELDLVQELAAGRPAYMIHGVFGPDLLPFGGRDPASLRAMAEMGLARGQVPVWWGAWLDPDHPAIPAVRQFALGQPPAPSPELRAAVRSIDWQLHGQTAREERNP